MKTVVLYEGISDMEKVRALFPAHRAAWQPFRERGELLLIGPFSNPAEGAMGIFTTREAAEAFVKIDPFVTSGAVERWTIREWREAIGT